MDRTPTVAVRRVSTRLWSSYQLTCALMMRTAILLLLFLVRVSIVGTCLDSGKRRVHAARLK